MNKNNYFCGKIVLIGKSNTGKSTLINKLIGKKISIVSHKKNTTRTQNIGIHTKNNYQFIYIDTPGIELKKKYINSFYFQHYKKTSMTCSDIIVFIINRTTFNQEDYNILKKIKKINSYIIIVINKIDLINPKQLLLPFIDKLKKKISFCNNFIPISAKKLININALVQTIKQFLPEQKHKYKKSITNFSSKKFFISEIIREKIINLYNQEIPYIVNIKIESIHINTKGIYNIYVFLLVDNTRQKKILIGKKGEKIHSCRVMSTLSIEKILSIKISLTLWVKVKQ
ncbi:MAG: GTPase Era [Buchnera aphidicola (Eriosoma harunire)]